MRAGETDKSISVKSAKILVRYLRLAKYQVFEVLLM